MNQENIIHGYQKYVASTYTRYNIIVSRGKGSKVWDISGKEYIDFFPGWAVSGIGHCNEKVVSAIKSQLDEIMHVPNNYYNEYQGLLAEKLIKASFPGKVFFCNSGAEAIESSIKLARRFGDPDKRYKIIVMESSFHGRTLGALSATAQGKYNQGFGPLVEDFIKVKFNDISSFEGAIDDDVVAVLMEPIQGEGGINIAGKEYLEKTRDLCNKHNILLIFDEVQTGMGRTGDLFCYQNYNVVPDIITLAKSLGSGIPIGAMIAGDKVKDILQPGMHASTFGGSPIACIAAIKTLEVIQNNNLTENAKLMGEYFKEKLADFSKEFSFIDQIRGKGLMIACQLNIQGAGIVEDAIKEGLLINCTQGNVLRFLPAINITKDEIDEGFEKLHKVLKKV